MGFKVYSHPAESPLLQSTLKKALPYSVDLVYRTKHENRTPDAHILATFAHDGPVPPCWAVAYLDRSMRPETELWMFSSGEMPDHNSTAENGVEKDELCKTCKQAVLSLFDHMSTLPEPPLHPENLPALELAKQHEKEHPESGPGVRYTPSPGMYMRHLLMGPVVTLGACHKKVVRLCHEYGLVRPEFPGKDAELNKFIFNIGDLPQMRDLPKGLRWGEIREKDIPTVQSRTSIPRTTRTLLSLKSVGVFVEETDLPVAWTFLGLDGSLTTLHTEPEYRGMGLAKAVAAKIIREYAPELAVDEQGKAWSHADVYIGNVQSEAVCKSLGGRAAWNMFWIRIDFAKAGNLAIDGPQ
ncbi:hypothetical protein BU24DRAFT_424282 [Aaosphaeria arxii CBS 175.79]|uniref:GCN5-related N-acetyltransferase Rv2170-like domain-containing protein n=1 Tax=Aaosphaeria arxii CBS 175.79 TaxID=1450172 RepID=A0A6A5XKD3_9PLEO|nr:uncharacterized protein BU24DRAFT_424282 [Aaosphaeria arxii CBS 175.79]KAF2013277.1 hypothetical protein BU24DRAFT_424282 [Aaosphaeria arxii CBS 175.79]